MNVLPTESFATGYRGETLVLMICAGWLWAGLYASPHSRTPLETSACVGHRVRVRPRELQLGHGRYGLAPQPLRRACRWLDRNGVRVREVHP